MEHQPYGQWDECPINPATQHIILKKFVNSKMSNLPKPDQKFVNLQYITLGCLDDGTNESSNKRMMFQAIFFSWFLAKLFAKILSIYFLIFLYNYKNKIKSFECPKSIKSIKRIILGISDSWSTIRSSHCPSM